MREQSAILSTVAAPVLYRPESNVFDCGKVLLSSGLGFERDGLYYKVGEITQVQGWIIHISVVPYQLEKLLNILVPFFCKNSIAFRIVADLAIAGQLQSGELGYINVGKTIKVYLTDQCFNSLLISELVRLSLPFDGPAVPTDIHLSGNLYARYGGFNPIRTLNQNGEQENYIYDPAGRLAKDEYRIPYELPKDVFFPFDFLNIEARSKENRILKNKYRIVSVLKADVKGSVLRAVYFKGLFLKSCVIKQGKKYTCADEYGRYISDRLAHQLDLYRKLQGKAPVPAIIDFFEESGDTYFAMGLINGPLLENKVAEIFEGLTWVQLTVNKRLQILDYVLQVVDVAQTLHENGIVHRDITPANFIVDPKNRLAVIDLELSFFLHAKQSAPPFGIGTIGFMSPEQQAGRTPTVYEDIYGLGALMIPLFTCLPPVKFEQQQKEVIRYQLGFFIQDQQIVSLILACLSQDPGDRPALASIRGEIEQIKQECKTNPFLFTGSPFTDHPAAGVKETIRKGLQALSGPVISRQGQIWASCADQSGYHVANYQFGQTVYMGLQNGLGGIIYSIARADRKTRVCRDAYFVNLQYLYDSFISRLPRLPGGLYGGAAGMAVALAEGIKNGLIETNESNRETIRQCLDIPSDGLSMRTGAAGIGVAALVCSSVLQLSETKTLAEKQFKKILLGLDNYPSLNWTEGLAGIATFLILYFDRFNDEQTGQVAKDLLHRIAKQASKNKLVSPWLSEGSAGIALCFLKAFEVFKDHGYARFAEQLLGRNPKYLSSHLFTHGSGLAGLGEVYLEAYKILAGSEWLDRAGWIASVFVNACRYDPDGGAYWVTGMPTMITADFAGGCSGIIHFLNRYSQPAEFSFPFLPPLKADL